MLLRAAPNTGTKGQHLEQELHIAAQRVRARRRWIVKAAVSLSLSSTLLIILVVLQRDRMAINDLMRSLDRPLAVFQTQIDELGQLPATFPDVPARLGIVYASDLVREYAREATGPVIIANSDTTPLILRSDGNGVVIYEKGTIRSEWWPRTQFVHEWLAQSAHIRKWDQTRRAQLPQLPQ